MIKFKATQEQIAQILALAANASEPAGLGYLHYQPNKKFTGEEMMPYVQDVYASLDYIQGRMAKCHLALHSDGYWSLQEPREDYQSWIRKYPTAKALVEAAGIHV